MKRLTYLFLFCILCFSTSCLKFDDGAVADSCPPQFYGFEKVDSLGQNLFQIDSINYNLDQLKAYHLIDGQLSQTEIYTNRYVGGAVTFWGPLEGDYINFPLILNYNDFDSDTIEIKNIGSDNSGTFCFDIIYYEFVVNNHTICKYCPNNGTYYPIVK